MSRLLVLILLILAGVWLVKRALLPRGDTGAGQGGRAKRPTTEELIACAHCGVHLPRGEARAGAGGLYCSEEHARLGKR